MKKLIALDIDGTLFNKDKEISPKTQEALRKTQERGNILVLASGRPVSGLLALAEKLEMKKHQGKICAYNGGQAIDCVTGNVIASNTIPVETAREFLGFLEQYPVTPVVDDGYSIYTNDPDGFQIGYESQSNHLNIQKVERICEAVTFSPAKILIAAPKEILETVIEDLMQPYAKKLSFTRSAPFYLEATPVGVNKAGTLKTICDSCGISQKDVIAFGDAENDVEMITFAGTGIAMGNAVEALKKIADMVTASNNEDGIAAALEQLELV